MQEYLIKDVVSLVVDSRGDKGDQDTIMHVKSDVLHFTYKPETDSKMALAGWLISKAFPKTDGHYTVIYKRTPNGKDHLIKA